MAAALALGAMIKEHKQSIFLFTGPQAFRRSNVQGFEQSTPYLKKSPVFFQVGFVF
jgi:hypothetical protein